LKAAVVKRAKNEFVKANLRLVVSIARRFNHGRLPLPDLIQEATSAHEGSGALRLSARFSLFHLRELVESVTPSAERWLTRGGRCVCPCT